MDELQGATGYAHSTRSSRRTLRRPGSIATEINPREERYRRAEAHLVQSFLNCQNEPSSYELQLRTLKQATHMFAQLAEDSGVRAKEIAAITASRAKVANLDPASYQSMLSQRWKAQNHQGLISRNMKAIQQAIDSLVSTRPGAGDSLLLEGHEDQVPTPEDKTYTNLVSFLCCPQRIAPLHHRSRSRLYNFYHRPHYPSMPTVVSPPPEILMKITTPDTSSDTSLDMIVQTPIVTQSLAEQQQTRFTINDEEAGTATILAIPLSNPAPPDPSHVKVELPDYVHELLADFDIEARNATPSGTSVKFQPDDVRGTEKRKGGIWPFKRKSKDRAPKHAASQPELRTKSSFKRLSGFMSGSGEMPSLRKKVNTTGGGGSPITLTSVSEVDSRDESDSSTRSPSSSNKVISRMASNIARRISFANLRV
ncbi:hypothetical protein NP233_g3983 [Leucocoprinus birnbaumii]|uniref:Uncharacterized protein n=1 Tax=Leucocoprinus birnbaumii TaxID=56174 RepID=A0AAD5YVZ7_9AGAR|nr:hypothetical protein NP233_g3983 [Leucocoprinus birnbaumii]